MNDDGTSSASTERPGELERFAVERAFFAAWTTELWVPADPDYGYVDYFEAAAARNLSLLRGFEELAEDIDRRGIIAQTDSDQAKLVTDGGQDVGGIDRYPIKCPECEDVSLEAADAVYAWCTDCDAEILRNEVDL